jgi:hypothetical protein
MRFHDMKIWVLPLAIAGWSPDCLGPVRRKRLDASRRCRLCGDRHAAICRGEHRSRPRATRWRNSLTSQNATILARAWHGNAPNKRPTNSASSEAHTFQFWPRDALFANERIIQPFPKPLAPQGYTVNNVSLVQPEISLRYLLFDSGKRKANVDVADRRDATRWSQLHTNQSGGGISRCDCLLHAPYGAGTSAGHQDTLRTAQTTQDAAEAQLRNGRATLPDVLNAKAETSQAVFDEEVRGWR